MKLPKFAYVEPGDLDEATAVLHDEPAAKVLAGGTDILVNMKHRVERPALLVNIKRIAGLGSIKQVKGGLRIGALATLKGISEAPFIWERFPALAQAASSVGSYHHQVMGTIGGNICQENRCKYFNQSRWWRSSRPICFKAGGAICHVANKKDICFSSYSGDVAPTLMVLGAKALLTGRETSRKVPIEDLFTGHGKKPLSLARDEILREVIIPAEAADGVSSYVKFAGRGSIDFPIVGVAFWASNKERQYRIAFTAVDRKPLRGKKAEAFLKGRDLDEATMNEAADMAAADAAPAKTSLYSPAYKRRMMGLLLQSAVDKALGRQGP